MALPLVATCLDFADLEEELADFFSDLATFADFLLVLAVSDVFVAASATGAASMETVNSTEAATEVRGVEPKNRKNRGESDRNMIHSARN